MKRAREREREQKRKFRKYNKTINIGNKREKRENYHRETMKEILENAKKIILYIICTNKQKERIEVAESKSTGDRES